MIKQKKMYQIFLASATFLESFTNPLSLNCSFIWRGPASQNSSSNILTALVIRSVESIPNKQDSTKHLISQI